MNQTLSVMEEKEDLSKKESHAFVENLQKIENSEERLKAGIAYMREALSQKTAPNFKGFWEIRKHCLPLFKEQMSGPIRSQLWEEYIELTREGRRLKNLLDEETAFAVEQIDLAISALEEEVRACHENPESILEKHGGIHLEQIPESLSNISYYEDIQCRLNLLNVFATRINSLRKELIKTEMRIRQKNKFFQRLSALGDLVFPLRKDSIREISDSFLKDIDHFFGEYFSPESFSHEEMRRSVFFFREEIKVLQSMAKVLTLNTHAFSHTREKLSECWDMLKGMEKELKKEYAQQRQASSENAELVREKIQAFQASYAENPLPVEEAYHGIESIARMMREVELNRTDVRILKEELKIARAPLDEIKEKEEQSRRLKEEEFENARKDKIEQFKKRIELLQQKIPSDPPESLSQELEEIKKILPQLSITKAEKQLIERSFKSIRDQIEERQQQALLSLSEDDRAALDNLKDMLVQRKERRREIKSQIEEYRKVIGGSALDFEKAMRYNEMMTSEKERLGKVDDGIKEIEKKIKEYKKKV